jgi:hypothetical protein
MSFTRIVAAAVVAAWSWIGAPAHAATPAQCEALATTEFGMVADAPTRVTAATVVPAKGTVPAYCRVEGYVSPQVGIEFHLPMDAWNGKFTFVGCGAMCGSLQGLASCPEAVARGYACGTTDMGHRAPAQDGKWAYANPVAEIDLGHRATHVATLAGKAITTAFYGKEIKRAYYRGCSTGGRQGLVEAQRYPYDFDGIVAGASVLYIPMGPPLQLTWDVTANLDRAGNPIMKESKLALVHDAALKACDALDGLKDGMITDPRLQGRKRRRLPVRRRTRRGPQVLRRTAEFQGPAAAYRRPALRHRTRLGRIHERPRLGAVRLRQRELALPRLRPRPRSRLRRHAVRLGSGSAAAQLQPAHRRQPRHRPVRRTRRQADDVPWLGRPGDPGHQQHRLL